jgi:hypothetical protein
MKVTLCDDYLPQDKALEAIKSIPKPSSGHTNLGAALEEGLDELLQNLTTDPSQPEYVPAPAPRAGPFGF